MCLASGLSTQASKDGNLSKLWPMLQTGTAHLENDRMPQTIHTIRAGTVTAGLKCVCDLAVETYFTLLSVAYLFMGFHRRRNGGRRAPNWQSKNILRCWTRHVDEYSTNYKMHVL